MSHITFLTDVDGTIAHSRTFNIGVAKPAAKALSKFRIETLIVTSKTLEATLIYYNKLKGPKFFGGPGIAFELGSAIAINPEVAPGYDHIDRSTGLAIIDLSESIYNELRGANDVVPERCQNKVFDIRFADNEKISLMTGLPAEEASLYKLRRYDLVLLLKDRSCIDLVAENALLQGFNVVIGARALHVLMGNGKVDVVNKIKEIFPALRSHKIAYAGDSLPDLKAMEVADISFVVPQPDYSLKVRPRRSDYIISPLPAPEGWAWIVSYLISQSSFLISDTIDSNESKNAGP